MDSVKELKSELLTIVGVCAAVVLAAVGTIGGDAAIAFIESVFSGCITLAPLGISNSW